MKTRCKFRCSEIALQETWEGCPHPVLHTVTLIPVNDGSEENKEFWEASPSGKFELGMIKPAGFAVGREYYIDIKEAVPELT